jgi:hypothetical protein
MSVTVLRDVDGREWHVPSTMVDNTPPIPAPITTSLPHTSVGAARPQVIPSNPFGGAAPLYNSTPSSAVRGGGAYPVNIPVAAPLSAPIRVVNAAPLLFPYFAPPPPFRFGSRNNVELQQQNYMTPPQAPLETEEPPPLWLRVLVAPFAFVYLLIKWFLYFTFTFIFVWLPEFLCVTLPIAIGRCCEPICPAIERCANNCCRGMHMAGVACCAVVRQVERAGGARR